MYICKYVCMYVCTCMYVCIYVFIPPRVVISQEHLHKQWHIEQFGARNKMQSWSAHCLSSFGCHWNINSLQSSIISRVSPYRIKNTCDKNIQQVRNGTVTRTKDNGDMTILFSFNNYHLVSRKTGTKNMRWDGTGGCLHRHGAGLWLLQVAALNKTAACQPFAADVGMTAGKRGTSDTLTFWRRIFFFKF